MCFIGFPLEFLTDPSVLSDYRYLSEHFRESHYLCEEGRCATEQFTHAFRSEIDYKAHKAAAHSKNRAEARQNRHIDLQFNYAPRQQRRNDGGSMWSCRAKKTFLLAVSLNSRLLL